MDDYEEMLARVSLAVKPNDTIEWLWVGDICTLVWESKRLRNAKAEAIRLSLTKALDSLLYDPLAQQLAPYDTDAGRIFAEWQNGNAAAIAELESRLKARGYTLATVEAEAQLQSLDAIERLDRLIASYDSRRDALLRDIERRRAAAADRLRTVSDAIIDESGS